MTRRIGCDCFGICMYIPLSDEVLLCTSGTYYSSRMHDSQEYAKKPCRPDCGGKNSAPRTALHTDLLNRILPPWCTVSMVREPSNWPFLCAQIPTKSWHAYTFYMLSVRNPSCKLQLGKESANIMWFDLQGWRTRNESEWCEKVCRAHITVFSISKLLW